MVIMCFVHDDMQISTNFLADSYGEGFSLCTVCKTERDYIMNNLIGTFSFYAVTVSMILTTAFIGRMDYGRYWRFVGLVLLAGMELSLLFYTENSAGGYWDIMPKKTRFEKIQLLHQLYVTLFIALSQIGPTLFPTADPEQMTKQLIRQIDNYSDMSLTESISLLDILLKPFKKDSKALGDIQKSLERVAIQTELFDAENELHQKYESLMTD